MRSANRAHVAGTGAARQGGLRQSAARRGVAAVELAFILPLLLLFIVGLWEVGRMVEVYQILTNSVREGGRQASTGTKTVVQIKDDVVRYLKQNGIQGVTADDVTVVNKTDVARTEPKQANQLDRFQITVSIPFDSVRWAVLNQVTTLKTLTASADWCSMRDIPITVDSAIPLN